MEQNATQKRLGGQGVLRESPLALCVLGQDAQSVSTVDHQ